MVKFKNLTDKYETCAEAKKSCKMGGWCTSCMYAYPGNAAISNKPENYIDVCTISRK